MTQIRGSILDVQPGSPPAQHLHVVYLFPLGHLLAGTFICHFLPNGIVFCLYSRLQETTCVQLCYKILSINNLTWKMECCKFFHLQRMLTGPVTL